MRVSGISLSLMASLSEASIKSRSLLDSDRTSAMALAEAGITLRTSPPRATVQLILSPLAGSPRLRVLSIWCASS